VSPTLSEPAGLGAEFLERNAAFGLQADVDDGFNSDDLAAYDLTLTRVTVGKGFFQKRGEIVARGICCRHLFS
jgi:hypothetical protein